MSEERNKRLSESIEELYSVEGCEVGGPLHIVLDDGNLTDDDISYCLWSMVSHWSVLGSLNAGCITEICKEIGETLLGMTLDERTELYENGWKVEA